MKRRTKGIIATITGVILSTTLVACGLHHKTPEEKADYIVNKASKELQLTAPQLVQLEQLKTHLLNIRQGFSDKKGEIHDITDELLNQPTLNQQRVLSLVQEHTDIINQKAPEIIASVAAFYDSLDTEQQKILREKIQKHRAYNHHGHH